MNSQLLKELKNPSNRFRGKPFWSWNGDLEKDELFRQIDAFKDMGFGGYFMHSRVGLETEYLGDKWFDLINDCADYGYSKDMESYLYDEDRWPSGIAGGIVTKHPEYRAKFLVCDIFDADSFLWKHNFIAAFELDLTLVPGTKAYKYTKCKRLNPNSEINKGCKVAAFYIVDSPLNSFCNGYTYVDTMNAEATKAFLDCTHQKYVEKCGDRIGSKIRAIFTDEPHRGPMFCPFSNGKSSMAPYTPRLFDEYSERFGDSLMDKLPELFFYKNGIETSAVKWQYVELLQQLFVENFFKPIEKWCSENNIALTGHALHEDTLACQVTMAGSMMRLYPHMHIPGVDALGNNHRFQVVKQLASAARQTGKDDRLSELYGCIGWQSTFMTYKSVGDWQSLLGVNVRCPHLSWYTMKGEGKRDYPASISLQSSWYKEHKYIEDYYARMHTLLAQGKPQCDLLVINPIETVWSRVRYDMFDNISASNDERVKALEETYTKTLKSLLGARIDFDYGDEGLMAEMASVTKNGLLKVGQSKYKKVLVCGADTLRSSTMRVLEKFVRLGGELIFAGDIPVHVDLAPSSRIDALVKMSKVISVDDIASACAMGDEITVTGGNIPDIFAQTRLCGKERYTVLCNISETANYENVELCLGEGASAYEINLRKGTIEPADFKVKDGKVYVTANFPAIGEKAYMVKLSDSKPVVAKASKPVKTLALPDEYSYTLSEENIYVMDSVSFRINGGRWSKPSIPFQADRQIRTKLKMAYRGGAMLQPWFIKKHHPEMLEPVADVDVRYSFYIKNKPKTPVSIVIESGKDCKVTLNGNEIKYTGGRWIDICYDKFEIDPSLIKAGKNEVIISTPFNMLTNIEDAFVIGDFGVSIENNRPLITKLPRKLKIGDIGAQGLPFYSGEITYKAEVKELRGEKASIRLPSMGGATAKVTVGKKSEQISFVPYSADITSLVSRSGKLELTLSLTRANTFGLGTFPSLHVSNGTPKEEYVLLQQGLLEKPEITIYK